MAENSSSHRQPGPRPKVGNNFQIERSPEHWVNRCQAAVDTIVMQIARSDFPNIRSGKEINTTELDPSTPRWGDIQTSQSRDSSYQKQIHMVHGGPSRRPNKRNYDQHWREQQVVFPVVPGGPQEERPLDSEDKARLEPVDFPLTGFCNEAVFPLGQIAFPVTLSDGKHSRTVTVNFMVMPATSRHDVLLGRRSQREFSMITSIPHAACGFPTEIGVAILYSSKEVMSVDDEPPAKVVKSSAPNEPEKWVLNNEYPEQTILLGQAISPATRIQLKKLLSNNKDIFAWCPADMTGVPRDIAQHCLNIKPSVEPVAQGRRSFSEEKTKAMDEQVTELLNAGILHEVKYHTWVANPVMVQKHSGGWRMCVDFKDLNKACPKDCYALPEIDKKVDSLASFRWKCFLDCYKGYHQVQMKKEDEDKTAFRTDKGIYCYTKMPFGLRNADATYQRLMDTVFSEDIGKTVEVYMDDLVIMSHEEETMLNNIQRTFDSLRSVNLKLNPTKCSFGMEEGKFLGFIVTRDGFKVNPEKVQAIQLMPSPATIKEMQRLAGRLAALNRFLANHAAKSYPFISTLRNCGKKTPFQWTPEAEATFKQMKECLIQLPTLTAPKEKEPLILYLSATEVAVGAVLMVERENIQTPIYYISKMLTGPETRYSMIEKLVLALIHASRRLRRYFSGHVITVLTNYHLGQILSKPDVAGRLAKWAIELGGYNIFYRPRPAIKGQVLADFATEVPIDKIQECEAIQNPTPVFDDRVWTLPTDGASNDDGAGAGLRLVSPDNHELTYAIRLDFQSTNNEAEYEAFLAGLRLALKMGARNLEANVDSKLVAEQVNGRYDAKGEAMTLYLEQARMLISQFQTFKVNHINRSENKHADALSKLAATSFKHLAKEVRIEVLSNPSIHLKQVSVIEMGDPSWMSPIILYLQHGKLPEGKAKARKIQHKAINYEMADGVLYRKSFMGPLLRCVDKTDAQYLVREIHEGLCGIHAGPRMVVAKIMSAGYYWPGMHMDAVDLLRRCEACQRHAPKTLRPKNPLIPVTSAWPFQQFGLPLRIISDNGTNFAAEDLQKWFKEMKIEHNFASVAHPQANGRVESVNKQIVDGIKARLGTARRGWVDELPSILWAHRTMPKTSTGETPFSLVYGSEAVIPAEIGLPSPRMIAMEKQNNEQERRMDLDLLEERRENAAITEARYKSKLEKYYNARVRVCTFVPGDFVLRDNEASNAEKPGKLAPRWEGPYVINEVLGKGAYTLKRIDGTLVPRTWNAQQLRRCYI
ncbi:uncharacterized protein LOC118487436 [Helianthus annuus]|uniref:uncharacterized protein LOC118487436 n=1 Tax=Helianthus annuus TaxID=4232 RepID=UPI0016531DE2|nr:uncharacterized protein LOC118487436 [Helianthus annuus]